MSAGFLQYCVIGQGFIFQEDDKPYKIMAYQAATFYGIGSAQYDYREHKWGIHT